MKAGSGLYLLLSRLQLYQVTFYWHQLVRTNIFAYGEHIKVMSFLQRHSQALILPLEHLGKYSLTRLIVLKLRIWIFLSPSKLYFWVMKTGYMLLYGVLK